MLYENYSRTHFPTHTHDEVRGKLAHALASIVSTVGLAATADEVLAGHCSFRQCALSRSPHFLTGRSAPFFWVW